MAKRGAESRDVAKRGAEGRDAAKRGAEDKEVTKRPPAGKPRAAGERGARARGQAARAAARARLEGPTRSQSAWEWVRTILGAFAIYFVVQAFLIQAFRIPSGSMENTLLVGDWLFVNKAIYGPRIPATDVHLPALAEPERFGIVVFESPIEEGLNLVKRVIGVAGDTLAMRDGQLVVNGSPQREPYVRHTDPEGDVADPGMSWQRAYLVPGAADPRSYQPTRDDWGPVVVPAGHFFMMGDNRDASFDSRYYGFVRRELIKGEPLFIYYSYDPRSPKSLPFLTAIRWDRIGQPIR